MPPLPDDSFVLGTFHDSDANLTDVHDAFVSVTRSLELVAQAEARGDAGDVALERARACRAAIRGGRITEALIIGRMVAQAEAAAPLPEPEAPTLPPAPIVRPDAFPRCYGGPLSGCRVELAHGERLWMLTVEGRHFVLSDPTTWLAAPKLEGQLGYYTGDATGHSWQVHEDTTRYVFNVAPPGQRPTLN